MQKHMESANGINVLHFRTPGLFWREFCDTVTSAAGDIFSPMSTNLQDFSRNLGSYDIESLRRVSFNDVVEFAKKHYFIAAIVVGVAIVAMASVIKLALVASIKLLYSLTKAGLSIVNPVFKLVLKLAVISVVARTICHMNFGQLNPITSAIARTIVNPVSVLLMRGTMILATFVFIANLLV
jgi:NO-binding membrane sensor protein with MHYT domain